jgi:putative transposase
MRVNPHLHILVSDGCFHENGMFTVSPAIDTKALEQLFRNKVLKMLLSKGKITQDMIKLLDKWRHRGFNVYCGSRILSCQKKSMENLACYIIRASFSQERMTYHRETGQVEYRSKDGKETKMLHALVWPRQKKAGCKHSPPCALTFPTKVSRWFAIMATIATWRVGNEKKPMPMIRFPVFWNRN